MKYAALKTDILRKLKQKQANINFVTKCELKKVN